MLTTRAPAKINLTLHILGRRADGYHELESLVAFTGAGDSLSFDARARAVARYCRPDRAGRRRRRRQSRAARRARSRRASQRADGLAPFASTRRLPVAAGIGGGSSDAAAALRLLAQANGLAPDDPRIIDAARATGSDVPVCLDPRARMMRGAGETLGDADPPAASARRADQSRRSGRNPARLRALGPTTRRDGARPPPHPEIASAMSADDLLAALGKGPQRSRRRRLPSGARSSSTRSRCCARARGCRLARMSGSGATCFALFRDAALRPFAPPRVIRAQHPEWWVKTAALR